MKRKTNYIIVFGIKNRKKKQFQKNDFFKKTNTT